TANGTFSYATSETDTATDTASGDTAVNTTTLSAAGSNGYATTQTGSESHWLSDSTALSASSASATETGSRSSWSPQVLTGDETSVDSAANTVVASSEYTGTACDSSSYSYGSQATSVQTPTGGTDAQTYQESGTSTTSATQTLAFWMGGTGSMASG